MQRIPSVKGQDRQLVMSTALARVLGWQRRPPVKVK